MTDAVHPLAGHFAGVSDAYERGRPEYPAAVVGALAAEAGLRRGDPVLDLAAGTGKLTRALHAFGLEVVAVEPLEALCAVLSESLGAQRVRRGTAEAIPLPDDSVAAVTVGNAFHWFDAPRALAEIGRVLRPGAVLAVLDAGVDWRPASWAADAIDEMTRLRPHHPRFDGPPWEEALQTHGWAAPETFHLSLDRPTDADSIVANFASMSWVAGLPEPERIETLVRFRVLIDAGETPARLPVHFHLSLTRPVSVARSITYRAAHD
ncbi:MAG TPA: methyltransferase domain-containing protein [Solirubrobacteraceae bacterium]|nr:methyltransferase domain-containing protein [Solirubrobacteraceae bacterium]